MEASIEIVKTIDGKTVYDEVYNMRECPGCGRDVARGWLFCPGCGSELEYGELPLIDTCENESDDSTFKCSNCGRIYVPVQVLKAHEGETEWNCCPGCMARLEK